MFIGNFCIKKKKKSETSEEKEVPKITRENVTGNAEVLKKAFMISHLF